MVQKKSRRIPFSLKSIGDSYYEDKYNRHSNLRFLTHVICVISIRYELLVRKMFTDEPIQDTPINGKVGGDTYNDFTYVK